MRFEGETRSRFEYRPDWLNDKLINLSEFYERKNLFGDREATNR